MIVFEVFVVTHFILHNPNPLIVSIADNRGFRDYTDSKIRAICVILLIRDSDIFRSLHNSNFFRGEAV